MVLPERVGVGEQAARFLREFPVDEETFGQIEAGAGVDLEIAPGVRAGLPASKEGAPILEVKSQ